MSREPGPERREGSPENWERTRRTRTCGCARVIKQNGRRSERVGDKQPEHRARPPTHRSAFTIGREYGWAGD